MSLVLGMFLIFALPESVEVLGFGFGLVSMAVGLRAIFSKIEDKDASGNVSEKE